MNEDHPWIRALNATSSIGPSSKKQYVRHLAKLVELADGRNLNVIVQSPRAMLKRIGRAYANDQSRKALVSAVKSLFKYIPGLKEQYGDAYVTWHCAFQAIDKQILDRVATAEPTEREKHNWIPWTVVRRTERRLNAEMRGSVPHLLVAMYTLIEPGRADYGNVALVNHPQASGNYIVLPTSTLTLNVYKTSAKYGPFTRTLPRELMDIIRLSLQKLPRTHLFVDDRGRPYVKHNSYTRFANRILHQVFHKNITISLLRHSFISDLDFNERTPAELMKISRNMMHSLAMQQLYRRKVDHRADATSSSDDSTSSSSSSSSSSDDDDDDDDDPRQARRSTSTTTTTSTSSLQITIPVSTLALRTSREELECHICSSKFCPDAYGTCVRASTHLDCCEQPICVGCLAKMSKRCTCKDECDVIIAFCPYCREISPVSAVDIFSGLKTTLCPGCLEDDNEDDDDDKTVV